MSGQKEEITVSTLELRTFSEEYLTDEYIGWLRDPQTVQYSRQKHRTQSLETSRTYWQECLANGVDLYALVNDGTHIGNLSITYSPLNAQGNHLGGDISILVRRSSWGKGWGTQAVLAGCEQITLKGHKLATLGMDSMNRGMIRTAEKAGFLLEAYRDGNTYMRKWL